MIVPIIEEPEINGKIVSRYIVMVVVECLAQTFYPYVGWNEMLVINTALDNLRNYARYGNHIEFWE